VNWDARDAMRIEDETRVAPLGFDLERDLICSANALGYFTSLNSGWARVLGWTKEELMSRPFTDFVHPTDRSRTLEQTAKLTLPGYRLVNFENRFRAKGGRWRWLRWSARSDGETWFGVAFDVTEDRETERRLRGVLTEDHLLAYSQPIVDQGRSVVVQEELLVRMRAEGGSGVVMPAAFLPDAERYGLVGQIDRWMVLQGIALASRGRRAGVNLSAHSIDDQEFMLELEESVRRAGPHASNLILEITETAALEHLDAAVELTERLVALGCQFALDDFGTGFAPLTHLRRLPVRYLKIDASFVRDVTRTPEDQAMIRAIVAIAHELDMRTVAEGIEDRGTLELLHEYGVDYSQGFLLGRPAPVGYPHPKGAFAATSPHRALPSPRIHRAPPSPRVIGTTAAALLVGLSLVLAFVGAFLANNIGSRGNERPPGTQLGAPATMIGPIRTAGLMTSVLRRSEPLPPGMLGPPNVDLGGRQASPPGTLADG
jgi:PAS domain S-box-containing protein